MALRISNVRTHVEEPESGLAPRLARLLGLPEGSFTFRILRKALGTN